MLDHRIEAAVLAFEESCHNSEHQLCQGSRICCDALTALGEDRAM